MSQPNQCNGDLARWHPYWCVGYLCLNLANKSFSLGLNWASCKSDHFQVNMIRFGFGSIHFPFGSIRFQFGATSGQVMFGPIGFS